MLNKPENVTVVILSDQEAKELSVRHGLRCLFRDVAYICRALNRHRRHFFTLISRGYDRRTSH